MPSVSHVEFPFDSNVFHIDLFESGNAPDYSTVYAPGVQAGRGATEGYDLKNCPKGDPVTTIEVTGNSSSDIMRYNYVKINFHAYANQGDGIKWYFVKSKRMLNYPTPLDEGGMDWYAMEFTLELDYWETYKDRLGSPMISLEQVTTSDPGGWNDISMLETDILPFSGSKISATPTAYDNWKTIVAWQAKKPNEQDNYVIDGMRTTLQWNSTGDTSDYLNGLDDLASGTVAQTQIWRSYVVCNTYIVSEYFTTDNGGRSQIESILLANPPSTQVHNRLNYFPYKRAFISTVDGQNMEFDYKKFSGNILPTALYMNVYHSTTPQPTSVILPVYSQIFLEDAIVFSAYPTMDFVGKNITPTTTLLNYLTEPVGQAGGGTYSQAQADFNNFLGKL